MHYSVNTWYRGKTGFFKKPFTRLSRDLDGHTVVVEDHIPRFTTYYFRYNQSSMRSPTPVLQVVSISEYETLWLEQCIALLHATSFDDKPAVDQIADEADMLYMNYGEMDCIGPKLAIERNYGLHEDRWRKALADLLEKRSSTKEYEAVGTAMGETIEDQTKYMYKMFGQSHTPRRALDEYFGFVTILRQSKITSGVNISLSLPETVKTFLGTDTLVVESESVNYRSDKIIVMAYADEEKELFNLLNQWYEIAKKDSIKSDLYSASGAMVGFNNVTELKETATLDEVYPVAVSPSVVELHFKKV